MKNKNKGKVQEVEPFYVKVKEDRGYGDQMFKVKGETTDTYDLFDEVKGVRFMLYKAHTYRDLETRRRDRELSNQRA